MKRRAFISLLGGAAAAWPLAALAQQQLSKIPRIGIIDPAATWDHLRQGLRDLGYAEGRNIALEYRSPEETPDRLVAAATDLAQLPLTLCTSSASNGSSISWRGTGCRACT